MAAHPAGNTTHAHRAWSPSTPAGTPQETTWGQLHGADRPPARQAGTGRPGTTEEFVCCGAAWWHQRAFCWSTWSLRHSELLRRQAAEPPTLLTSDLEGGASLGGIGAQTTAQPGSGSSAPRRLGPDGCQHLHVGPRPRVCRAAG